MTSGERMYQVFKDKGLLFQETTLAINLADHQQTTGEVLTTQELISSAGLVLDVKNACWYFRDNFTHKYPFGEELNPPYIAEMSSNTCQLKEGVSVILLLNHVYRTVKPIPLAMRLMKQLGGFALCLGIVSGVYVLVENMVDVSVEVTLEGPASSARRHWK
ncbi:hypothetical protein TNIN_137491 [Trichonephila inaurata madagascariensis]|uniref:Uncharacterized protein n=1 Tax=Trichonephila inaurata madagascariensis TaxID=2747483 RepID=A0A8X7CFH0_9ARAC|nr:hypothetical protein TNIN_137491 [Trichonephila inaurata madagascariensis]